MKVPQMPTKPCLACGEQIQSTARRCPHCLQQQDRLLIAMNSGWAAALLIAALVSFFAYNFLVDSPQFKNDAGFISYETPTVFVEGASGGFNASCIAVAKSTSKYSWKDPHVEAKYFSGTGALIDTSTQRLSGTVLLSGGEAAIRVLDRAARDAASYARCEVAIKDASRR